MEKLTSLNLSFDRVLIQLVIPGLIAMFPYLLVFTDVEFKSLATQFQEINTLSTLVVILVALITGIMIENIGSRIEVYYYDWRQKKRHVDYELIWEQYLQLSYENEPIGQRYLRNILFRMKFELSTAIALLIMVIGFGVYESLYTIWLHPAIKVLALYLFPLGISAYLIFLEGWSSSRVLHGTRKLLVDKYQV